MDETVFYLPSWEVTEADYRALAGGRVPEWLQDVCRRVVDWNLETGSVDYVGRREAQQTQRPKATKTRKTAMKAVHVEA